MSDPVYNWIVSLGADTKSIHSPQERVKFLCKHFQISCPSVTKTLSKKMLSGLRNAVENGGEIDAERFVALALSSIQHSKKWDIKHIAFCRSRKFYQSSKWKSARINKLAEHGSCRACGASPIDGVVLHVDHILPRSIYPEYALSQTNLQVLCAECNIGKGNTLYKKF